MKTRGKALRKVKKPNKTFFNRPYYADERALQGTKNKQILKTHELTEEHGKLEKKSEKI